jgi:hypothetical protein
MRRQRLNNIQAQLDEAADDKEGVTVAGRAGVDFGILDSETPVEVAISVTSSTAAVSLRTCRMLSSGRADEHGLKYVDLDFFFELNRKLTCRPHLYQIFRSSAREVEDDPEGHDATNFHPPPPFRSRSL